MMDAGHMLSLSQPQAEQLAHACAAYRSYAWQMLAPTPERNQTMRVAQAMQGRLAEMRTLGAEQCVLRISEEERQALRTVISTLIQVYGAEPPTPERTQLLGVLAALRALLERSRQTQAF